MIAGTNNMPATSGAAVPLFRPGRLVVLAIVVHCVLCYSVIDIHFQSPVLHDISPVSPETEPPAKRLVLIVADGNILTVCSKRLVHTRK